MRTTVGVISWARVAASPDSHRIRVIPRKVAAATSTKVTAAHHGTPAAMNHPVISTSPRISWP